MKGGLLPVYYVRRHILCTCASFSGAKIEQWVWVLSVSSIHYE